MEWRKKQFYNNSMYRRNFGWKEFCYNLHNLIHCLFGDHKAFPNTIWAFFVDFSCFFRNAEQSWFIKNQGWSTPKQRWSSLEFLRLLWINAEQHWKTSNLWNNAVQRWIFLGLPPRLSDIEKIFIFGNFFSWPRRQAQNSSFYRN